MNRTSGDHPRACGEKVPPDCCTLESPGSPPRMRGKGLRVGTCAPKSGITPAHAGKRANQRFLDCLAWDHPRACGEKLDVHVLSVGKMGSPPRMRGKGIHGNDRKSRIGITPAHAGKSDCLSVLKERLRDHPRACGEKLSQYTAAGWCLGSPPRMRGKDLESIEIQALFFLCAQISFNF